MAWSWGGATQGGVQGGTAGASFGPYGAAGGAILGAILGGVSKKKDGSESGTGDILNLASAGAGMAGGQSGGGSSDMVTKLLSSFGGSKNSPSVNMGAEPSEGGMTGASILNLLGSFGKGSQQPQQEPQDKVVQTTPQAPQAPAPLIGFPSLQAISIQQQLKNALAASRGF